jgi:hypothetical protein
MIKKLFIIDDCGTRCRRHSSRRRLHERPRAHLPVPLQSQKYSSGGRHSCHNLAAMPIRVLTFKTVAISFKNIRVVPINQIGLHFFFICHIQTLLAWRSGLPMRLRTEDPGSNLAWVNKQ